EEQRQREEAERAESEKREAEAAETKRKQEEAARIEAEKEAERKAKADAVREAQEQAKKDALERARAKRDDTVDSARSRARENLRRAAENHGRTEADVKREQERGKRKELHVAEGKKG